MSKIYIEDFCEDLNYQGCILYIDTVDSITLQKKNGGSSTNSN